ncbi:MAG TPA: EthD family reductase [Acidimicrobiia bacterium]|nr:EthD family reductase [Acidimicrobiia bacterium]HZQ79603.1 EthD family reductase [Acidimicrobiia bacterium]
MIRVSVMYPRTEGGKFDMDYYVNKHMPMVADRCGAAMKGMTVAEGIAGGQPGEPPTYTCVGVLAFDSVEAFQGAFGPHMAEIMGDIPNYTNISPVIQISEVRM